MYTGNSEGLTGEVLQIEGGSWYELWWSRECCLKREEDGFARRAQRGFHDKLGNNLVAIHGGRSRSLNRHPPEGAMVDGPGTRPCQTS